MHHQQKVDVRAEYRHQEARRAEESSTLIDKFPQLKSLTVDLAHFNPESFSRIGEIKYKANLQHARSVLRFDCVNRECVGGDFDLSDELAKAVAAGRAIVTGEVSCQGWRNRTTIDTVRCHNILRYKLSLSY